MDTINKIELGDESTYQDEQVLRYVLVESYDPYCALLELYDLNQMTYQWRYYQDGKAWLCKVQKGKQTIIWMSAWKGFMQATIYVPLRLIDQVYALQIGPETIERIRTTKNVGKSKPCIFEIRDKRILEDLDRVMQFKIKAR